jgi:hypothetical protein
MKTVYRRLRNGIHGAVLLALMAAAVPGGAVQAQAALLVLTPSSGDPPSVNGSLSGGGWCTPAISVTVSGTGVSGSGQVGRDGSLTGNFSIVGSPGDTATIVVEAACRAGTSVARAQFHFNTPAPTRTPTPRPVVTWLPRHGPRQPRHTTSAAPHRLKRLRPSPARLPTTGTSPSWSVSRRRMISRSSSWRWACSRPRSCGTGLPTADYPFADGPTRRWARCSPRSESTGLSSD